MPRDGSQTYTAPSNSWNPAVEGTEISETDWNEVLDDLETALSESVEGPSSAVAGQLVAFDGTTGKLVKAITSASATAYLNNFVGDSGSGGTAGLVPAPASGDAAAHKFLKADGTWNVVDAIAEISSAIRTGSDSAVVTGTAGAAGTIVGWNSDGDVVALSSASATAYLNAFVGDSGTGGTLGAVPAPASGDAAAGKYLKADGTWATAQAQDAYLDDIAALSLVQGDVLYFDGTDINRLAAGTTGQFLKTNGSGANPAWATLAGGGDMLTTNNLSDLASTSAALTNLGISAYGRTIVDDASAGAARTTLGLAIGTNVQAYDAGLNSIAGLTTAADKMIYTTASDTYAVADLTSFGRSLIDDASAGAALTTLGVTTYAKTILDDASAGAARTTLGAQAQDAVLDDLAGASLVQGDVLYYNGTNLARLAAGTTGQFLKTQGSGANPTWATLAGGGDMLTTNNLSDLASTSAALTNLGISAYGRTIVDDASAGAARTTLGVAIGTDVQAYDAGLNSIAGLTTAADKMIYATASDTYAVADLTSFGRSLVDDASAGAALTTLGVTAFAQTLTDDASAGAARTTLGLDSATAAEYYNNTSGKLLTTDKVWTAASAATLTDAASISWDMDTGINFAVTLAGNRTLANPTNVIVGKTGRIVVAQDATGSRTLSFGANYVFEGGTAPTLTTTALATDVLYYDAIASAEILITSVLDKS